MRRLCTVSLTITLIAFSGPVLAARACKDGFIVYTGSAAAPTRALAEASALRAWRAGQAFASRPSNPSKSKMTCVRESGNHYWRCHMRGGRCSKV